MERRIFLKGAAAAGVGSAALAADDLTLNVTSLPVGQVGYFLMSDAQANVPGFGGSQGVLCIGAPVLRFVKNVLTADAGGQMNFGIDFANLPGGTTLQPGETWNFQLWYRDVNPSPTSNTSNGLAITFE